MPRTTQRSDPEDITYNLNANPCSRRIRDMSRTSTMIIHPRGERLADTRNVISAGMIGRMTRMKQETPEVELTHIKNHTHTHARTHARPRESNPSTQKKKKKQHIKSTHLPIPIPIHILSSRHPRQRIWRAREREQTNKQTIKRHYASKPKRNSISSARHGIPQHRAHRTYTDNIAPRHVPHATCPSRGS